MTPKRDFKGTSLFDVERLRNSARERHSYDRIIVN